MEELADVHYHQAVKIALAMDNLNTLQMNCLYEAFEPAEARQMSEKIEVVHTSKHGSLLNMAESELSVMEQPWQNDRIGDEATLCERVRSWGDDRTRRGKNSDRQFVTADAGIKLRRLCSQIRLS